MSRLVVIRPGPDKDRSAPKAQLELEVYCYLVTDRATVSRCLLEYLLSCLNKASEIGDRRKPRSDKLSEYSAAAAAFSEKFLKNTVMPAGLAYEDH